MDDESDPMSRRRRRGYSSIRGWGSPRHQTPVGVTGVATKLVAAVIYGPPVGMGLKRTLLKVVISVTARPYGERVLVTGRHRRQRWLDF